MRYRQFMTMGRKLGKDDVALNREYHDLLVQEQQQKQIYNIKSIENLKFWELQLGKKPYWDYSKSERRVLKDCINFYLKHGIFIQ